jgi:hypothetical protein
MAKAEPQAAELPPDLLAALSEAPVNIDRRGGAELVTRLLFLVSHRTLEAWPLPSRRVNGRAVFPTRELLRVAHAKLSAAPVSACGRDAGGMRRRFPG